MRYSITVHSRELPSLARLNNADYNFLRDDVLEHHNHQRDGADNSSGTINHAWLSHGDLGDYPIVNEHKAIDEFLSELDGSRGQYAVRTNKNVIIEAYDMPKYLCEAGYDAGRDEKACNYEWYGQGHHAYDYTIFDIWAGACYPDHLWFFPLENTQINLDHATVLLQLYYNHRWKPGCRQVCNIVPQPTLVSRGFRDKDGIGYLKIALAGPRINQAAFDKGCKREETLYPVDDEGNPLPEIKYWTTEKLDIRIWGMYALLIGPIKEVE